MCAALEGCCGKWHTLHVSDIGLKTQPDKDVSVVSITFTYLLCLPSRSVLSLFRDKIVTCFDCLLFILFDIVAFPLAYN